MSMNGSRYARHYQQRGAFTIMTAGVLAMALLCLVLVVDTGRLYMEQRSLQRVADMAALEAVSRGGVCRDANNKNTAFGFAEDATTRNKLNKDNLSSVTCINLITNADGVRILDPANPFNDSSPIIRVIVEKTTPASLVLHAGCLFTSCEKDVTLQAIAIAGKEEPIAAFSVGSRLIRFDNESALGGVLELVGLDLGDTTAAGYNGLANIKITPEGLLKNLGLPISADLTVGDLNALLATEAPLNVLEILRATVTVAGKSELLDANIELLKSLTVATGIDHLNLTIPLLTQADGTPGLFAEIIGPATQSANSALSTQISALGIIEAALGLATREHALNVEKLNINLLGLVEVKTKVGIVEPPSIAIGGIGTTAYTAQVRTFIHVKTGSLVEGLNNLVSLLGINLIHIDLPIALDLVTGKGVLEEKTCRATADIYNTGRDHAEIAVSGKVGQLCIGEPLDESQLFSKSFSCESSTQGTKYLDVLGLVKLDRTGRAPLTLGLLDIEEENVYLSLDSTQLPSDWADMEGRTDFAIVGTNSLNVGDLVEDLVNLLLDVLVGESTVGGSTTAINKAIATEIWNSVEPVECDSRQCRRNKVQAIGELAEESGGSAGLLGSLVGGLLNLVEGLLQGLLLGNGCTINGLVGGLFGDRTDDSQCINLIASELPHSPSNSTNPDNHLGLGILRDLLNVLGNEVLKPILEKLLGLHVSEVDVHLQDLNCGHARLLQ
ncbi:pilus assembly protein TadG-related protein [Halopseudomonas bauzanensis]|nr:pilus assembly protein TadG-related protein [Halopseudomonas bauzanensis]